MTRRLFYLNALLLLVALVFGMRLRMLWLDAREREEMVRLNERKRLTYTARPPTPQVQAVNAMTYTDVAMRMLFSRDRNPVWSIRRRRRHRPSRHNRLYRNRMVS